MIKNQRQYKLTMANAESFAEALARLSHSPCPPDVDPIIHEAEIQGIESQLNTLRREIKEYELLCSGDVAGLTLTSLAELPLGLIKARIAGKLTQKDLAQMIGVKPQQIQRWEYEDYEGVGFQKLIDIANALNLNISEHIELPTRPKDAFSALKQLGLEKPFIAARLACNEPQYSTDTSSDVGLMGAAASRLSKIFGVRFSADGLLTNSGQLQLACAGGRFKLPSNADGVKVNAYSAYAHYLAKTVASAAIAKPFEKVPRTWQELRRYLCGDARPTFEALLQGAWSRGIAVLPLADPINFHGVCWRISGRNVVILKQSSQYSSRWAFNLLHEIYHAGESPDEESFDCIEMDVTDAARRESEDEAAANRIAGDVLLDGRADELYQAVLIAANNKVVRLKKAVQNVAAREDVNVADLANYVAYRVKSDLFVEWWGTAANLQPADESPLALARKMLVDNLELWRLESDDKQLLLQALQDPELHA